jgi:hypothetical protein
MHAILVHVGDLGDVLTEVLRANDWHLSLRQHIVRYR